MGSPFPYHHHHQGRASGISPRDIMEVGPDYTKPCPFAPGNCVSTGAGPGGLRSSCPHCAMGTDGAFPLSPPTPLTLHLARIQSLALWALALGKHLSVRPDMWSRLTSSVPQHFREDHLLLLTVPLTSPQSPQGWWTQADVGRLCLFPQHSREGATFSYCGLHPRPSH